MSKRFGMFDIFQATLELIVFVSLGEKSDCEYFFSSLNLADRFFKENTRQHSLPSGPKS